VIAAALSGFVLAATRGRVSTLLNGYSWVTFDGSAGRLQAADREMQRWPFHRSAGWIPERAGVSGARLQPRTISFADSLGALLEDVEEKGQQARPMWPSPIC
jgi:hypothetical protein